LSWCFGNFKGILLIIEDSLDYLVVSVDVWLFELFEGEVEATVPVAISDVRVDSFFQQHVNNFLISQGNRQQKRRAKDV
jgi:hypothetical protein